MRAVTKTRMKNGVIKKTTIGVIGTKIKKILEVEKKKARTGIHGPAVAKVQGNTDPNRTSDRTRVNSKPETLDQRYKNNTIPGGPRTRVVRAGWSEDPWARIKIAVKERKRIVNKLKKALQQMKDGLIDRFRIWIKWLNHRNMKLKIFSSDYFNSCVLFSD